MRRTDFHFDLPDVLIARHPVPERSGSRLLHLAGATGALVDRQFRDLPQLLRQGDLLVFNDTRVIPARLFGHKLESGGRVEIMLERLTGARTAIVQLRASKPARTGAVIALAGDDTLTVVDRDDDFWRVEFSGDAHEIFDRHGEMPLPPYVARAAVAEDRERYQTVYAREPGAVAAPTAGLHFDEQLLQACRGAGAEFAYVTLHVGAGTFQPVRVDNVEEHRMHSELCVVSQRPVPGRRGCPCARLPRHRHRHDGGAFARERGRERRVAALRRRNAAVHHTGQTLPCGRCNGDQFSPA